MDSRDKGKRGEREAAGVLSKLFKKLFVRAAQVSGRLLADVVRLNDEGVIVPTGFHFEVKRRERLNIVEAMTQAKKDAKEGEVPIILHRINNGEWLATFRLEDWPSLIDKSNNLIK